MVREIQACNPDCVFVCPCCAVTPKQSMDVLREVRACKAKGRPYVCVFVGVNGVGKSTSLSKVSAIT